MKAHNVTGHSIIINERINNKLKKLFKSFKTNFQMLLKKNPNDNAFEIFWEEQAVILINELKKIRLNEKIDAISFYEILISLQQYINSRDFDMPGRYKSNSFFGVSLIKTTTGFNEFNKILNEFIFENKPQLITEAENISYIDYAKSSVTSIFNGINKGLKFVKEHPMVSISFLMYSQSLLVETTDLLNDAHLVAYYPFDGNAIDMSPNENDGIVHGAQLTTNRFGHKRSAYYFDGELDTYIKGDASHFPSMERTVSLWFKPDIFDQGPKTDRGGSLFGYGGGSLATTTGTTGAIIETTSSFANRYAKKDDVCGTSFLMVINDLANPPNSYEMQSHCDVNKMLYIDDSMYGSKSIWNHFALTTSYNEGTKFFLNGVLVHTNQTLFVNNTLVKHTSFGIGTLANQAGYVPHDGSNIKNFKGAIDDVMIFNRSLSSDEITQLFDNNLQGTDKTSIGSNTLTLNSELNSEQHKDNKKEEESIVGVIAGGLGLAVGIGMGIFLYKNLKGRCKPKPQPKPPILDDTELDTVDVDEKENFKTIENDEEFRSLIKSTV